MGERKKMKKILSIFFITTLLCMLTSCSKETYGDIEGTLVEKYQESYKGRVYNYFRLEFDDQDIPDDILLFKVDDAIYISYSNDDTVPMTVHKKYTIDGSLTSITYEFKDPK